LLLLLHRRSHHYSRLIGIPFNHPIWWFELLLLAFLLLLDVRIVVLLLELLLLLLGYLLLLLLLKLMLLFLEDGLCQIHFSLALRHLCVGVVVTIVCMQCRRVAPVLRSIIAVGIVETAGTTKLFGVLLLQQYLLVFNYGFILRDQLGNVFLHFRHILKRITPILV